MRQTLIGLGCPATTHTYLGDGVYCGIDEARQVWLVTDRYENGGIHKIALDNTVLKALWRYLRVVPRET